MRRPTLAELRSTTGLIIGLYVTMHLSNHALGLISIRAQEAARPWVMALWHSPPGQVLLYGSLSIHAAVALIVLFRRRTIYMPAWEAIQILLGLTIPYLLLVHIVNTRGTRILTGIDIDYTYEIANLWVDPWTRFRQIALVLLVWGHFAVGLHFWWRLHSWYRRAFPAIVLGMVLVPMAALLGFAEVGMTMTANARTDPQWLLAIKARGVPSDPSRAKLRAALKDWIGASWFGVVGAVFCMVQVRNWRQRHARFKVTYPDAVTIEAPIGMSVLEVSRMAQRAHMSVCGGRARCTTCRVRIAAVAGDLPKPMQLEAAALRRIGAPSDVRLACQLRPQVNLTVHPLLHPRLVAATHGGVGPEFGEEREVTILFVDVRGSTSLAEKRLPYDVVFLLNSLFAALAESVEESGGYYSNFTGDGLMALFGLNRERAEGARAALQCALTMFQRLDKLNDRLADELETPLAIGVGIHTGEAIVGRMGPPKTPILSAIGDSVNTAARLESTTKELGMPLVVSEETLRAAGISTSMELKPVSLRGRTSDMAAAALDQASLRQILNRSV
ncbi:MAG TPA: adenylate/guanylate cyclase domain-containing protein [Chthoniobacterales bacterium]|nr:adenylate/guanylate cyclase domain-containing protein [Chthoniobacterales bacterium]